MGLCPVYFLNLDIGFPVEELHGPIRSLLAGRTEHDQVTSARFADPLTQGIASTEVVVFEDCAHAPIYENVEAFNQRTLDFLHRHSGPDVSG